MNTTEPRVQKAPASSGGQGRPLQLRRLRGHEADFMNALRRAADIDLACIEPGTLLQWRPCGPGGEAAPGGQAVVLSGGAGALWLDDGAAFLHALTGIPLQAQVEPAQRRWLCGTAAALLPAPLRAVFDTVELPQAGDAPAGSLKAQLVLRTDDHLVATHGSATWPVWHRLLETASGERPAFHAVSDAWACVRSTHPLVVGRHALPAGRLATLAAGDIVLPRQAWFDVSGRGRLRLGPWLADVAMDADQQLEVLAVYSSSSADGPATNEWDDETGEAGEGFQYGEEGCEEGGKQGGDEAWGGPSRHVDGHGGQAGEGPGLGGSGSSIIEPLSALHVPLRFSMGTVSLSLAELQGLAPGSVLRLQSPASPAQVEVRAGGRVVGQGELIDVDGRLGVQLTAWAAP